MRNLTASPAVAPASVFRRDFLLAHIGVTAPVLHMRTLLSCIVLCSSASHAWVAGSTLVGSDDLGDGVFQPADIPAGLNHVGSL